MELVDITQRLDEAELRSLLALSVGSPTRANLEAIANRYRHEPTWRAYAFFVSGVPSGACGLEISAPGAARIRHIATRPALQRFGVGRRLLAAVRARESLTELYAETDADGLPFYQRCGFTATSLGERYPGVERFACCWRAAYQAAAADDRRAGWRLRHLCWRRQAARQRLAANAVVLSRS